MLKTISKPPNRSQTSQNRSPYPKIFSKLLKNPPDPHTK